jgi:hypothetical protein
VPSASLVDMRLQLKYGALRSTLSETRSFRAHTPAEGAAGLEIVMACGQAPTGHLARILDLIRHLQL